jgi:NADH-quinone oxidoreductase subunit H
MFTPFSAQFFVSLVLIAIVSHMILGACAYLIFLERKVAAWTQDRIGPNRTKFSFGQDNIWRGLKMNFMNNKFFFGLGQALADGIKLLVKEDYTPPQVDRILFCLAPVMIVIPAMIGWAVVPWGGQYYFPGLTLPEFLPLVGGLLVAEPGRVIVTVAPISIGVIFMLAVSSLGVYGVVIAAYASNNKYSFLGGLRATAQMLSYEIPMGVCVIVSILCFRSSDTSLIVSQQAGAAWGIMMHPLLAVIFFICVLAETNRAPFDLAEAEQELVGGFHTEYSSMKWALFFLAEYMHMIAGSAFFTILFLGGWDIAPLITTFTGMSLLPEVAGAGDQAWWLGLLIVFIKFNVFVGKITLLLFVMMWIRWTLPRFRFDQLMKLAWRGLIPITLAIMVATGILVFMKFDIATYWWVYTLVDVVVGLSAAAVGPYMPGRSTNARIPLEGSRFNPPAKAVEHDAAAQATV